MKILNKVRQFVTLTERQQKGLSRVLIFIAFFATEFGSKISNYFTKSVNDDWTLFATILIFNTVLIMIAFRKYGYEFLGGPFYRSMMYVLGNNGIDRYLGYTSWSINDTLTVFAIFIEFRMHKKIKPN